MRPGAVKEKVNEELDTIKARFKAGGTEICDSIFWLGLRLFAYVTTVILVYKALLLWFDNPMKSNSDPTSTKVQDIQVTNCSRSTWKYQFSYNH